MKHLEFNEESYELYRKSDGKLSMRLVETKKIRIDVPEESK
jgi:hypothetical protein